MSIEFIITFIFLLSQPLSGEELQASRMIGTWNTVMSHELYDNKVTDHFTNKTGNREYIINIRFTKDQAVLTKSSGESVICTWRLEKGKLFLTPVKKKNGSEQKISCLFMKSKERALDHEKKLMKDHRFALQYFKVLKKAKNRSLEKSGSKG